jgi:UDP-N-acetyl-D-galactosamine dehydrogenase
MDTKNFLRKHQEMSHSRKVSVVGLGYVGLPVAVAFGRHAQVIGFDINPKRIEELSRAIDRTEEVTTEDLQSTDIHFTSDPADLKKADFHIVAVPTPIDSANIPDLTLMLKASESVGKVLKKGDIVVYESTVYPGATEDDCVPVLEKYSGLKCGKDFTVGYSPERINPGDKEHTFTKITKVVSGQDAATLETVAAVYGSVVKAGVFRAASIKTAEAAKVIENTQRDINIALMNELALILGRMNLDIGDVLAAAGTKWNFLRFTPGLVGGHCIGVDPFYLTHKAARLGYTPEVILAGRRINDSMGYHIANQVVRELCLNGCQLQGARITVLGLTFKENVPDLRNSKIVDIVRELRKYGADVQIHDPGADANEAKHEYDLKLTAMKDLLPAEAVVLGVSHKPYVDGGWNLISGLLRNQKGVVFDVKGILPRSNTPEGVVLRRL